MKNEKLIYAKKDKKEKEKKEKDKKEKEKKEKKDKEIKDKIEKNSSFKDKIKNGDITSEKIHSEKINTNNIDKGNNINKIQTIGSLKKENQIKNFTQKFEKLQIDTNNIIREIQQSAPEDINSNIKDKIIYTKEIINDVDNNNIDFMKNLDKEERELIRKQNNIIQNSQNNLIKIFANLDKELDKKNKNIENLFNKTKELEKEVKIIYRQYRAIEWILFEK